MKNIDSRYWIELTAITALLIVLGLVGFLLIFPGQYAPALPFMLGILVILTVAGQIELSSLLDKKFSQFNTAFLIYKGLKLFVLMVVLIIYSVLHKEHAVSFILGTFVMYLVYMIFEARSLNRQSRKQAKR